MNCSSCNKILEPGWVVVDTDPEPKGGLLTEMFVCQDCRPEGNDSDAILREDGFAVRVFIFNEKETEFLDKIIDEDDD